MTLALTNPNKVKRAEMELELTNLFQLRLLFQLLLSSLHVSEKCKYFICVCVCMCVHVSIEDIIFIEDTNTFGMEVQTRLGKIFGENMEKSL